MLIKNISYSLIGVALALGLSACSDDPSIDDNPKERIDVPEDAMTPDEDQKDTSGAKTDGIVDDSDAADQIAEIPYTKFDLEVKYGPNKKYDVDYELVDESGEYKAEIQDFINNKNIKGMEAFQALHNLLKNNEMNKEMSKEDTIQKTLEIFQLGNDYANFDLEYTLKDGTKIDIEDNK